MGTNDTNNQLTDTGHCLAPIPGSGTFIMLARNGNLITVCEMIQKRAEIAEQIQQVEQQLLSCNNPYALSLLGLWHGSRNRNFENEFIELAEKLETKKRELALALQKIDEQLALQNLGFDWKVITGFVNLIPTGARPLNPSVVFRNMIIDQNLKKSGLDICRILDSNFRETERPPGFLPESWQEKYGVKTFVAAYCHPDCRKLVEPMISKRQPRSP